MLYIRRVVGTSMLPTYEEGQMIIALRPLRKVGLHDIVIISHDGREKIKRVTDMQVDKVYVRGDNPRHSTDSRHFGWIPIRHVKGRVIWPINRVSTTAKQKYQK